MEATALTGTGATMDTPGFMSPEQAEGGRAGSAGDVFSLDAVLAFAATAGEPCHKSRPVVTKIVVAHSLRTAATAARGVLRTRP
ncbi:hypothetical protein GCM10022384_45910 [Streptomyces marokkonensis]|uniref:Uncharacterized protein n=1 Tax=Streptomyces marokkonensis TaxID=324855 RepID=A0ABP7R5Z8_9ACTN